MTPAEELRSEAERAVEIGRLRALLLAAADARVPPEARDRAAAMARLLYAKARLFERCAESLGRLGFCLFEALDREADAALAPIVAAEREAQRLLALRVRAAWERSEKEAAAKLAAWRLEGR